MQIGQHDPFRVTSNITPTEKKSDIGVEKGYSAKVQESGTGPEGRGFIHTSTEKKIIRAVAAILTLGASEVFRKELRSVTSAVFTETEFSPTELNQMRKDFVSDNTSNNPKRIEIETRNAKLDGMLIAPNGQSPLKPNDPNANKDMRFIVSLHGKGERYENTLDNAKELADKSGAHVLVFNYRGTGESRTAGLTSPKGDDWVNDTVAMVAFLKSQGVPEENITFVGHSMGGAIGTKAADRFDQVKLVNDRSFESLSKATKEYVRNLTDNKAGQVFTGALGAVAGAIVGATHNLNAGKVLNRNEALQARTVLFEANKDPTISPNASLAGAVTKKPDLSEKKYEHIVMEPSSTLNKARFEADWKRMIDAKLNYAKPDGLQERLREMIGSTATPSLDIAEAAFRKDAQEVVIDKFKEFNNAIDLLNEYKKTEGADVTVIENLQREIYNVLREINPGLIQHYTEHDAHNETLLSSLDRMEGGEEKIKQLLQFINPNKIFLEKFGNKEKPAPRESLVPTSHPEDPFGDLGDLEGPDLGVNTPKASVDFGNVSGQDLDNFFRFKA